MAPALQLTLANYDDPTRWRWRLEDGRGRFLADHLVHLDPASREARGFRDLRAYLDYHEPIQTPADQLAALGRWIGQQVFGGLLDTLRAQRGPATPVRLVVPAGAQELLARPYELARFADGTPLAEHGIRFIYQVEGAPDPAAPKDPVGAALRILAVFSLPVRANPLNLRRERYQLQQLVRRVAQAQGRAVELRVLQYGASRAALQDALEEADGWDIVHLSGHGRQGELLLEDEAGREDIIDADELGDLLELAQGRLKLLLLDACYSGASSHAAARAQVGLDGPTRADVAAPDAAAEAAAATVLPNLAVELSQRLDCAALAMRYPVDDTFATDLLLALYEKLLERRQRLPAALQLALADARAAERRGQPLAIATPILVGPRSCDLQLGPPQAAMGAVALPAVGLGIAFPPEPRRFVGRLQPMLRASHALAVGSAKRGVLFYGMPGAGKTACALELAYRHEQGRFPAGHVWYQAPPEGSEIATALFGLFQEIQTQLNAPQLGLTAALENPAHLRSYILPRLRALLQQSSLLLVLDNLESLLDERNAWRDPLWGEVVGALLGHNGPSRVVLTTRRLPADLAGHPLLQVEPIHALSFAESVLLARELPGLGALFADEPGRNLLRQTLRAVQGHPKLLELADGLAGDRAALAARVQAAVAAQADREELLDLFMARGGEREGETRQGEAAFLAALREWTAGAVGRLGPTARLLFTVLCCLEPDDRRERALAANWNDILTRLGEGHAAAAAALAEGEAGRTAALAALEAGGLVAVQRPDPVELEETIARLAAQGAKGADGAPLDLAAVRAWLAAEGTSYGIHPGVAEAARALAAPEESAAVDVELGAYHRAMVQRGLQSEQEGGGGMVIAGARRAVPYLLRQARWHEASYLLERLLQRDTSPNSLAFALPLLRRIAAATAGTKRELNTLGVLANALLAAGQHAEAEDLTRDVLHRSIANADYRGASVRAGVLVNLLMATGRLEEALRVAEQMAGYTRQAEMGPWSQLGDEAQRLQVLAAMGQYNEVLAAVVRLRPQLATLSMESDGTTNPWNVREGLLDAGRSAALHSQRWELALDLNTEGVKARDARGAPPLELARFRFNDYGPLLRLRRYDDARALLLECRAVFEAERDRLGLGKVYSALANLEDKLGNHETAARFENVAFGYRYQTGQPEECAISHNNLSNYLGRQGAATKIVLTHRLADAIISLHTRSGQLSISLRNIASMDLPPAPPPFAEVVATVEAIPGVRFRALYAGLPGATPDGEASIAAVWELVAQERQRQEQERQRQVQEALDTFAPLLQRVAAAAGDPALRPELEAELAELEKNGWKLREPAQRIWEGERGAEALTTGLDAQDTALVRRVLELLA